MPAPSGHICKRLLFSVLITFPELFLLSNTFLITITTARNSAPTIDLAALNVNVPTAPAPLVCATNAVPQINAARSSIRLPVILFSTLTLITIFDTCKCPYKNN